MLARNRVQLTRAAALLSESVRLGRKLLPSRCGVRLPRETYKSIRRFIQAYDHLAWMLLMINVPKDALFFASPP